MDNKMTTWTLNAVLGTMVASVLLLPSPSEIKKAIEFNHSPPGMVLVSDDGEEGVEVEVNSRIDAQPVSIEIGYDPAADCLERYSSSNTIKIAPCLPALVETITTFDKQAKDRKAQGRIVYPSPRIEEMRLAVINLCRVQWVSQNTHGQLLDNSDCREVTQGVAY